VAAVKACLSYEASPTPEFSRLASDHHVLSQTKPSETKTVPSHSVHLIIIPCNGAAHGNDQSRSFHGPAAADYLDHQSLGVFRVRVAKRAIFISSDGLTPSDTENLIRQYQDAPRYRACGPYYPSMASRAYHRDVTDAPGALKAWNMRLEACMGEVDSERLA
jgi:hypothetical protein